MTDDEFPEPVLINPLQAEAMCTLLIEGGEMTPLAAQMLRKLWTPAFDEGLSS